MTRRLLSPALVLLAACGGTAPDTLVTRTDSAGVWIVTSTAPAWQGGGGWRIDPEPTTAIGPREDGDPHYEFFRAISGAILPNGEIVVLVAASHEVRFFSPTGEWLRSIGRDGDGPGEIRRAVGIVAAGDTIFVRDGGLGRLSAFSTAGTLLTSWPFPALEGTGRMYPSHRLADGSWIGSAGIAFGGNVEATNGTTRYPMSYLRIAADLGGVLDTIATTPGSEQNVNATTGPNGSFARISIWPPPFGRSAPIAVGGERFIWGDNASPELRIHGPQGTLTAILRWTAPPIPVTRELITRIRDANLALWEGNAERQQGVRDQYAIASLADEVPYFSGISVDPDGAIWVTEYQTLPTDSVRFQIFHPDGQLMGSVALGPRHTVLDVGREQLLTVWLDQDDVEHVRVYRVRK